MRYPPKRGLIITTHFFDHGDLTDKLGMTTEELLHDDGTVLEGRLRERFHPPAGFRMPYDIAELVEVGIDDISEHGGFWDGPVYEGGQWTLSTHWTAQKGLTFRIDCESEDGIPAGEAPKVAAVLAEVAATAASNDAGV